MPWQKKFYIKKFPTRRFFPLEWLCVSECVWKTIGFFSPLVVRDNKGKAINNNKKKKFRMKPAVLLVSALKWNCKLSIFRLSFSFFFCIHIFQVFECMKMKANERRHTCANLHTTLLNEKRNWLPFIVVWHFPFGGSRFLPNGWKIIAIAIYKFRAHVDLMCSSSDVCVCEPLCVPSSISIGKFYQPPRTHTLAQTPTDINYIHFVPVCFKLLYFPFYECNGIQFMRQKVSIHCRVWCLLFFCVA